MKIIIKPLEEVYDTIKTSTTRLEAFEACPKKFNEVPRQGNKQMEFGIKLHEMMQHFLYNKEKNYNIITELFIESEEDPQQQRRLSQMLDLAYGEVPEIYMAEKRRDIEIECGKYLVILTGKIDNHHSETGSLEDSYPSDTKTSASFWKEGSWVFKFQPYVYLWMHRASLGVFKGKKRFDFHIFKKLKKMCQYQHVRCDIDLEDAEYRIIKMVKKYVTAYHANIWKAKKNIYCGGCPLKKNDMCEIFNPILARKSNLNESTN